ncbi:unnamed protein product [Urochloa humidicola]
MYLVLLPPPSEHILPGCDPPPPPDHRRSPNAELRFGIPAVRGPRATPICHLHRALNPHRLDLAPPPRAGPAAPRSDASAHPRRPLPSQALARLATGSACAPSTRSFGGPALVQIRTKRGSHRQSVTGGRGLTRLSAHCFIVGCPSGGAPAPARSVPGKAAEERGEGLGGGERKDRVQMILNSEWSTAIIYIMYAICILYVYTFRFKT